MVLSILDSNWNFSGWFDGREAACLELAAIFHLATRRQNSTFFRKLPLFRCKTDKKLLPAPALPWFSCSRKLHYNVQRFWSKAHCAAKWFSGFIVQYLWWESNRLWLMIQDQPHCFCSIESAQHDDRMTWWQPQGDLLPVSSLHQRWQWWRWKTKLTWWFQFSTFCKLPLLTSYSDDVLADCCNTVMTAIITTRWQRNMMKAVAMTLAGWQQNMMTAMAMTLTRWQQNLMTGKKMTPPSQIVCSSYLHRLEGQWLFLQNASNHF